ncbi:hypothetical protein AB0L70_00270 [Kribbella sp. NPDC051952]|uniref:hypothetical protein n=1 Tax=Kribbella sp. NPDC051952 TaxID=3154851 RepID=UPI003430EB63
MKRVLLTGLLVLAVALGVGGGYFAGDYLDRPLPSASGDASPLGNPPTPSPSEPSLPVKTPIASNVPPLETGLDYVRHLFTVTPKGQPSVQLSLKTPEGWTISRNPKEPGEVKYLDRLKERGVRVEAVEPLALTPAAAQQKLIVGLRQSQPPENDLKILSRTTEEIEGEDGGPRTVATLIYTYIPIQTLRYVVVRWIALPGDERAAVEMSITGLPQDADGLAEVLREATTTVHPTG